MNIENAGAEVSRHKCLIYDGKPSEQLPVVVPFLKDGLRDNWRCLYLGSPEMVEMVDGALVARGTQTRREVDRGALILSSDRSHLTDGNFEPQMMIEMLCESVDKAVGDGFEGLCATGDMRWELGANKNFDRLLEYEASLEQIFRDKPLRGICQYHRDLVPAKAVRDALVTHQSAFIGDTLNSDNLFYIPPEFFLEERDSPHGSRQGEWMCQQILRVLKAEEKRDKALAVQRRLAQELEEANRSLERRVKERTAELEAANSHLEAFSYSVSHDLRAPLRSIIGFSEILASECSDALGEEGRGHLQRVRKSAGQMGELIEGLLHLARVVRADLNRVRVDLTALAEDVVREIREREPDRAAVFVIAPGMQAAGDPILIRSVLVNLVGNAWKFSSKRPDARIEIGEKRNALGHRAFYVKDNGAGFDDRYAEKLFGAFQRMHKQEEFAGTGVGLATVQRIITKHGGKIWAESRPNEGATFYFTLPIVDSSDV